MGIDFFRLNHLRSEDMTLKHQSLGSVNTTLHPVYCRVSYKYAGIVFARDRRAKEISPQADAFRISPVLLITASTAQKRVRKWFLS